MNFIADRNVRRALNATIEQQNDSHLGGLYQVTLAYHDILFGVSSVGLSARKIHRLVADFERATELLADRQIRERNSYFRLLREHGFDQIILGTPAILRDPHPLSNVPATNYCPYCSRSGHFPINCTAYVCPACLQGAPGHFPVDCPNPQSRSSDSDHERPPTPFPPPTHGHPTSTPPSHSLAPPQPVQDSAPLPVPSSPDEDPLSNSPEAEARRVQERA